MSKLGEPSGTTLLQPNVLMVVATVCSRRFDIRYLHTSVCAAIYTLACVVAGRRGNLKPSLRCHCRVLIISAVSGERKKLDHGYSTSLAAMAVHSKAYIQRRLSARRRKHLFIYLKQEAFEKCWAHSPLRAAARPSFALPFTRCRYCRTPPLSHAVCASMSTTTTTTTTTTRDRGDRYGPMEWAQ